MRLFRVTQHEPKPLTWWHQQHRLGHLDMKPTYQRRSDLWNPWKQAHLIDSVINGFDVPKFYVADFTGVRSRLNRRRLPYAIIDGKQRFEAIFKFFDGQLALNQSASLETDPAVKVGGLSYSDLKARHPSIAARLEDFRPVVMSVATNNDELINQMFIRLNSGEPANSAERRNAMPGPIPGIIRDLTLHPFFQRKIRFNVKRMQEFNLVAKLLMIEYFGKFVDTKARNLDHFVEQGWRAMQAAEGHPSREKALIKKYSETEKQVQDVLETMSGIFLDHDPLLTAQGHIPVYYWIVRKNPAVAKNFRKFLEGFTKEIRTALEVSRTDPNKADAEIMNYYTRGRTTNDQSSLQDRYDILLRRLKNP